MERKSMDVTVAADAQGGEPSQGILWTVDSIGSSINSEDSPWGDLKEKPLNPRRLANINEGSIQRSERSVACPPIASATNEHEEPVSPYQEVI